GDGANHDEARPSQELAAAQMASPQPVKAEAAPVSTGEQTKELLVPADTQAVVEAVAPRQETEPEQSVPVSETSVEGDRKADTGEVMPRRSSRVPGYWKVESPCVVNLLSRIQADDPGVDVLKLHNYISSDVNTLVIDAVLDSLMLNNSCQALYIQNFDKGFRDEQLLKLAKVLRRGVIWCLNAGEIYDVTPSTWWKFVEDIKNTNVTHAYLSEHGIPAGLKTAMRNAIRDNRAKHTRHNAASNVEVIRRCTNMWWNPINSEELQAELHTAPAPPAPAATGEAKEKGEEGRQEPAASQGVVRISSSGGDGSSSGGGGSEGDENARVSGSEAGGATAPGAARGAAREAIAEKPSGSGSASGSTTSTPGQQEQLVGRGGRNKRRRSGRAGGNATTASATERDSKKASGTGRAENMSDEPKSRAGVWAEGFSDDEAAMDFEDACYESDVEAREELEQEEKKEREAWERERKPQREKEKQKRAYAEYVKDPKVVKMVDTRIQPVEGSVRTDNDPDRFHDETRCGYCNAGTELKTSEELRTERTDRELLIRKKRYVRLRF
ncbi:unnamed protein product, partial [Ectocarpus sp. 12 AP-2014]